MGMLNKLKKKANNIVDDANITKQIQDLDILIDEANKVVSNEIKKFQDQSLQAFNQEINLIKGKTAYVEGIVSDLEQQSKVAVEKVFNETQEKVKSGMVEVADDFQLMLETRLKEAEQTLQKSIQVIATRVETEAKKTLETIAQKAEAEAKKKFESEMGMGFITFILNRLKEFFK